MALLGDPGQPLKLLDLLAKAARNRKCVAYRIPTEKGKKDSCDLFYMTSLASYQQAFRSIAVSNLPQLRNFGGENNQFLRLKTADDKNTYNRLFKRKDQWLKLEGPVQVEAQLVSPMDGELAGHISWKDLAEKLKGCNTTGKNPKVQVQNNSALNLGVPEETAAAIATTATAPTGTPALRQPFIDEAFDNPTVPFYLRTGARKGVIYDDDSEDSDAQSPRTPPPTNLETPKPKAKSPSILLHPKSPLFGLTRLATPAVSNDFSVLMEDAQQAAQEDAQQAAQETPPAPTWMQQRNKTPPPANGETHVVVAEVLQRPEDQSHPALSPVPEVVTMEDDLDDPEEPPLEIRPPVQQEPLADPDPQRQEQRQPVTEQRAATPAEQRAATPTEQRVATPTGPNTHVLDLNALLLDVPTDPDPRAEVVIPPVESLLDPVINRFGSLMAEYDNMSVTILRHTNLLHDNRFPVLPVPKLFQVPSVRRVAVDDLAADLNRIYEEAAEKASMALIRAEVEASKLIRSELSFISRSRIWTMDDLATAQAIRLSRSNRLQPYRPSNRPPTVFFEVVDGVIKPHTAAAEAHTTAGREAGSAVTTQQPPAKKKVTIAPTPKVTNSRLTPEQKKEKNRRRLESRKRRRAERHTAATGAAPSTAAPNAAAPSTPAPSAPAGPAGNGQQPRQTGNRGNNRNDQQPPRGNHRDNRQPTRGNFRNDQRPPPGNHRSDPPPPRTSVFNRLGERPHHSKLPGNVKIMAVVRAHRRDPTPRPPGYRTNYELVAAAAEHRTGPRATSHGGRQRSNGEQPNGERRNQDSTHSRTNY